ncbi:MAG: Holliday junction branch migration DNA helicase RuvB [Alphaproteobacteria bacterium]|nr:Holliday junction branch migration DNA helicase RuvB [Alphaproteobacteria bacterium]
MKNTERIFAPVDQPEDQEPQAIYRPVKLNDFIGQQEVTQRLTIFIDAALKESRVLDHVILSGPPGLGKTTLGSIIAKELGVGIRITAGPLLTRPGDLAAILTNLQAHDVLFIDEIHRLTTSVEETLYSAMEDFRLDIVLGEGPSARVVQVPLPRFTLIGATTRLGLITRPLRERFGIHETMRFYNTEDLTTILRMASDRLSLSIEDDALAVLANCSRGTPRIALRLIRRVYDVALYRKWTILKKEDVFNALKELDIDKNGMDVLDRAYIAVIGGRYKGGPVGIDTLASLLSEQKDVIEDTVEPYLIARNLVDKTPRGRMLTEEGKEYYSQIGLGGGAL